MCAGGIGISPDMAFVSIALSSITPMMIMTQSEKIIFVETKGDHLKNDDSRDKIALGQAWKNAAGSQYRYYMVFRDGDNLLPGAVSISQFLEMIKAL